MPPVFLKAKEYDPALAAKALARPQQPPPAVSDYNRHLLVELGLADEDEPASAQPQQHQQQPSSNSAGDGAIATFYPYDAGSPDGQGPGVKAVDELHERLEAAVQVLTASRHAGVQEVQHLLYDQQHQIELLLRGHNSLKSSMGVLRRTSKEQEVQHQRVQEQLEQQHAAAIREMEGKLEKAITQVQLLQQATRQRQQQQEASSQLALQGASKEAAALKVQLEELQAAFSSKEQALAEAQQHAEQHAAREAALSEQRSKLQQQVQQLEQRTAAQEQQLQQCTAEQQAACSGAKAQAAVLAQEHAALAQLQQQLAATQSDKQQLQERLDSLAADAGRQAASAGTEVQQLQATCQQLRQQLADAEAVAAQQATSQQAAVTRHTGLQQQLVDAVKAHSELQVKCEQADSARLQLQATCRQLQEQLAAVTQQQAAAAVQEAAAAAQQCDLQVQLQQLQADKAALQEALVQVQAQHSSAESRAQSLAQLQQGAAQKLEAAAADSQKLQWKLSALQTEHQKAQRAATERIQALQQEAERAASQLAAAQAATAQQVASAEAAAAQQVERFRLKWRAEFDKRRALHNTVTELRGNIRVLARVRSLIEKERTSSGGGVEAVTAVDEETLAVAGPVTREFSFDRVLGPSHGQAQVYEEVAGVVSSVLDGYNACVMAYGQTAGGKTYTMEGPADDPGVISRALTDLFQLAADRSEISYAFSTSVLEIYNEQLVDLLSGSRSDAGDKLDIKEAPGGGLFIPGLRIESVACVDDVAAVLQKGKQGRSTFATNMNEHSSRSHLVLSVFITAQDLVKGSAWSSKLHLIDLAGSERVSRSRAEGERLKEAASINKSLSALGDVVAALQARSSHVPYRNSKLTRLLEDALGGSAKTLLLVNVSPAAENVGETRCSLEFAARARKVELRLAPRNPDVPPSPAAGSGAGGSPVKAPPAVLMTPHSGSGGGGSAASSPRVCSTPGRLAAASRRGAMVGTGAAPPPAPSVMTRNE